VTLAGWLILLLVAGAVLLLAELILPAHGVLGACGVVSMLCAVGVCFRLSPWASLGLLLAMLLATPFAWSAAVRIWPNTPIGRRVVLPRVEMERAPMAFQLGQKGVAVGDLKPMGECSFEGKRVDARAESGIIPAGTPVVVVSADGRMATVRAVEAGEVNV
jgi:membrane-bound ClpP family serine protease